MVLSSPEYTYTRLDYFFLMDLIFDSYVTLSNEEFLVHLQEDSKKEMYMMAICYVRLLRFLQFLSITNIILAVDEHFSPKIILPPGTLCIPTHFAQHILLTETLYSSAHIDPQHTLITGALCSLEHFALSNSLLSGIHYFLEHLALSIWC